MRSRRPTTNIRLTVKHGCSHAQPCFASGASLGSPLPPRCRGRGALIDLGYYRPREGGGGGVGAAASSRLQILASRSAKMAARAPNRAHQRASLASRATGAATVRPGGRPRNEAKRWASGNSRKTGLRSNSVSETRCRWELGSWGHEHDRAPFFPLHDLLDDLGVRDLQSVPSPLVTTRH